MASDSAFHRSSNLVGLYGTISPPARSAARRASGTIRENQPICRRTTLSDAIFDLHRSITRELRACRLDENRSVAVFCASATAMVERGSKYDASTTCYRHLSPLAAAEGAAYFHFRSRNALTACVRVIRSLPFFLISLLTWLGETPFSRAKCSTS